MFCDSLRTLTITGNLLCPCGHRSELTARGQQSPVASSRLVNPKMKKKLHLLLVLCFLFVFFTCSKIFYSLWVLKGNVRSSFNLREPPLLFSTVGGPEVALKQLLWLQGG